MKKFILFAFALSLFAFEMTAAPAPAAGETSTFAFGRKVMLRSGTLVLLQLDEQIQSSRMTVGQMVKFKVTTDVIVDGRIAIRTGALAYGRVKNVAQSTYNNAEEITFEVKTVQAVDGQQVALNGAEQILKGAYPNQGTTAPSGATISATVMNDVEIKTN